MKLALFADKEVGFEITKYLVENYPEDLSLVMTKESNVISALANSIGDKISTFKSEQVPW